nr:hypothetical protein [uncultured Pedobacter sp.]
MKKVIARELLILIGIIPCLIIGYCYYYAKGKNIEKAIVINQNSYDSVMNILKSKNRDYIRKLSDRELFYTKITHYGYTNGFTFPTHYTYDKTVWTFLENLYSKNELNISNYTTFPNKVKNHLKRAGIENFDNLYQAVKHAYISPTEEPKKNDIINKRDKFFKRTNYYKNHKITNLMMSNFLKNITIGYLAMLFGLRYFIMILIWSIKTVRSKEKPFLD